MGTQKVPMSQHPWGGQGHVRAQMGLSALTAPEPEAQRCQLGETELSPEARLLCARWLFISGPLVDPSGDPWGGGCCAHSLDSRNQIAGRLRPGPGHGEAPTVYPG